MSMRVEQAAKGEAAFEPLDIRHVLVEDSDDHPSAANGIHVVARNLAREQLHAGDRAKLLFLAGYGVGDAPKDVPVEIIPVTGPALKGHHLWLDGQTLDRILEGAGPRTVFHLHGVRRPLLVSLAARLRRRGIRYGITAHSRYAHIFDHGGQLRFRKTALYVKLFERPILEGASFVHALTEDEIGSITPLAPKAPIHLLQNGAFSSALDGVPVIPGRAPRQDAFPVFGFCGRLAVAHKGLDVLAEGFALYRQAGGRGRLHIAGTGEAERLELQTACERLRLAGSATVDGPRFGNDRDALMTAWDFFVLPSRYDRMPLAALEAGLLGLPLLLTEQTGIFPAQHGAGLKIPAVSAGAVAETLRDAENIGPEQWRAMSQRAHDMVAASSDWTLIARRMRELYRLAS